MFLEEFLRSPDSIKAFQVHADRLRDMGAYALMLELLARKSEERSQQDAVHKVDSTISAVQREAWARGYYEALTDIFDFARHGKTVQHIPQANFSAAESLVRDNTITREEYEQLTGKAYVGPLE